MSTLTSGTRDAAHRRDVYGVVYALTGTLKSTVSGIPNATFYWSSKELVSGGPIGTYSGGWEPYISVPKNIDAELPLKIGDVPPLHMVNILVKNLPFRHSESLVTAITDGDWAWEGTEATLYAAYQKKDQAPEEIPSGDWFPVRKRGQFSGPQDVGLPGFTLPFASREIVRRQSVKVREVTSGDFPSADPREYGKVLAVAYGMPDTWIRARRTDAGVFCLTTDTVLSGQQNWVRTANDAGFDMNDLTGKQVYLHRQDIVYTVDHTTIDYGSTQHNATLVMTETITHNIPHGALVQEKKTEYRFAALNVQVTGSDRIAGIGFELLDGRVVPLSAGRKEVELDTNGGGPIGDANGYQASGNKYRTDLVFFDSLEEIPALIPRKDLPSDSVDVIQQPTYSTTQQPVFSTEQQIEATKDNYPTGPAFASAAYDGNDGTGYSVPSSGGGPNNSVTFTFPSVPGANFDNGDTIKSTLHFISQGIFQVTDAGIVSYITTSTSTKGQYKIELVPGEEFNQSVRFIEQGGGGIVYEIWWTHELQKIITVDRDADVIGSNTDVVLASSAETGYDMVPIAAVVFRYNGYNAGGPVTYYGFRPAQVFRDIQERYLGEPWAWGPDGDWWDQDAYEDCDQRHEDTAWHTDFVIDKQFTWSELEADLAKASRCYAFYGGNGHAIKFAEDASTMDEVEPYAEFRLPGTPNPNVAQTPGSPIMERTSLADLVNVVRLYYDRNNLVPRTADFEDRYAGFAEGRNEESIALHGEKRNPNGFIQAWPLANAYDWDVDVSEANPYYGWTGARQAQILAQFYADRAALGTTRFTFDTNGEVVGVGRGDIVRVVFAPTANVYRNVLCEVESVKIAPLNAHRYTITCRSIGTPQKGLTSALIWTDLFTADGDTWAERITGVYDRWDQYWRAS